MQRFLELSQPFQDAHFQPQPPSPAERLVWVLRWALYVVACGMTAAPRPLTTESKPMLGTTTDTDAIDTANTSAARLSASLPAHLPAAGGALW